MTPTPLLCPSCIEPLMTVRAAGLSLDGCARCGGVWLLRDAAGAARHLAPDALAAIDAQLGWSATPTSGGAATAARACPGCRAAMEQRPDSLHPSLRIDACRACSGVWLDPGELSQFRVTSADRAAAAGGPPHSPTGGDHVVAFAWCADILGALLDIATDS